MSVPMPPAVLHEPEAKRRISPALYIVIGAATLILILAAFYSIAEQRRTDDKFGGSLQRAQDFGRDLQRDARNGTLGR